MASSFDVYLSYDSKDRKAVRRIAEYLKNSGLNPWHEEEELRPEAFDQVIIENIRAIVVCVGEHGVGSWRRRPVLRAALDQIAKRGVPVIPVLLPGSPEKPDLGPFLSERAGIDLRGGLTEEGLDRLVQGIKGKDSETRLDPPQVHNLPFPPLGDLFTGRDEVLRRLAETLGEPGTSATVWSEAISGLGGIGKTRLAVEYAWLFGRRYTAAFFVPADSPERLRRSLARLAGVLRLLPDQEEGEGARDVALRWLREHPGWLLILDGVDTPEAARDILEMLPVLRGGQVLITSRLRQWPPHVRNLSLDTLATPAATDFLLQRTEGSRVQRQDDPEQAARLAEDLAGLPLALEQAAAYIAYHQVSLADYRKEYQRERGRLLEWSDSRVMQYPVSLAATWQTTFQQLGVSAAALLRLAAYLAPAPIPLEMLAADNNGLLARAVELLGAETGQTGSAQPTDAALAELAAYSLIARHAGSFTVHPLVQEVLRSRIPKERQREWIGLALRLVEAFAPPEPDDARTWPVWDSLRPHAEHLIDAADRADISQSAAVLMPDQAALMPDLGSFLLVKGLYREAEPLLRRSLASYEAVLPNQDPGVAASLNNLALLLGATGRASEAETLLRHALAIDEAALGAEHRNASADLNNLAVVLWSERRLEESEELLRRSLAICEAEFGRDHPRSAVVLNNLAVSLLTLSRLAEAEPLLRRAFEIDQGIFGPDHPKIGIRLGNLAFLLQTTGRAEEAEPLLRRAEHIFDSTGARPWFKKESSPLVPEPLLRHVRGREEATPVRKPAAERVAGSSPAVVSSELDPLLLAFLLVLTGRAKPQLLINPDRSSLLQAVSGLSLESGVADPLVEAQKVLAREHPNASPNALWAAWMRASRGSELERIRELFP